MLRFDKAWSLDDVGAEPSCDLHLEGEAAEGVGALSEEGQRRPLGVTRECEAAAGGGEAAAPMRTAIVGMEHDGLVLIARYWPGCTEVGYVRAKPEAAFHQPSQFCLLHRARQRQWIVHASLSSDMAYLALTTWRHRIPRARGAEGASAPAESEGPFQAFVLRIHAPGTDDEQRPRPPHNLRVLARAMRSVETGLPTSTGGNEPGCFTGASVVEWLLRQPLRSNPTRDQAEALGLQLLQYRVIVAVDHDVNLFADDEDLLFRFNDPPAPVPGEESSEDSDMDDNAMMQQAEQMMSAESNIADEAHARRRRRRRSSRLKRESKPQLRPGLGSGSDIPATSEIQGLHVTSWTRPTIQFINFASFETSTVGGERSELSVPVGSSFLLCHQGIKHFTITRGSFINTNPIILVKNCIWHSYNPSHRLLYYLAVSTGQAGYAFNCYSFEPDGPRGRPHHEFSAWLHIPGLPEVRRSRQTSEQRLRESIDDEDAEIESGLETWEGRRYTPAAFSITRLRGATVCLCHQHRALVEAPEIVVTVYMLHRQESLTINVPMSAGPQKGAGRRLVFGSLADYIIIYAAGKVLLLVDCSTAAPRCGSLSFVGAGLVPCISKTFVKMPAAPAAQWTRRTRPYKGSPNSGGESEYEDALSHQESVGLTRVPSALSWQDSEELLGTPPAGPESLTSEEPRSTEVAEDQLAFEKEAIEGSSVVGEALANALLSCDKDVDSNAVARAKDTQHARLQMLATSARAEQGVEPELEPEPEMPLQLDPEPARRGSVGVHTEPEPHVVHLHSISWLDELPADGELANGMWELDCFSLVVDCESSAIFRISFDPDVVLSVGSAALRRLNQPAFNKAVEQTRVTEDLLIKLFHFSWLHLNDGTMAEKLAIEILHAGVFNSVVAARVFREYILSGADASLRRQYAPRVLSRTLLEKDRISAVDPSSATPATSVTYGTHGAIVAKGTVTRSSQLCITQVEPEPSLGTDDEKQSLLAVKLGVQQCDWTPFPDLERSSGTSRIGSFAVPAVPMSPAPSTTSAPRSIRTDSDGQDNNATKSPALILRTLTRQTPRLDEVSFKIEAPSPPPPTPIGQKLFGEPHVDEDDSPYTQFATASSSGESTELLGKQRTSSLAALNGGGGTDSGSGFEAQRRAVAGLHGGRGLKYLANADVAADRLFSVVPPVGRMEWRATCCSTSARYSVAKWEQVQSLYTLIRHETQELHQMLTVAVRSLDLSDAALDTDQPHALHAADVLHALRPLLHMYQTLCSATQSIGVPLPDDFDTHHLWLAALLLPTSQIFRMLQCDVLRLTPALYEELTMRPATSPRFGDEHPELQFELLSFLPAPLALEIVRRSKNSEFIRYGAEAGLWSAGARLVQPVEAAEHDGRTHAAVLEAVNRDGFADSDPNPLYSLPFQSNAGPRTTEECDSLAATETLQVDVKSITGTATDNAACGEEEIAEPLVGDASNSESLLPTPISRDAAASTSSITAAAVAGTEAHPDKGAEVFRTWSTTPERRSMRDGDGSSAVLPAVSSPLFEPQAALLHTVRVCCELISASSHQLTCADLLCHLLPHLDLCGQMRAHQSGVLGTETVGYMTSLICDPPKQQVWPDPAQGKGLSPSLSKIKSACVVVRTDSGNVDI